MNDVQYVQRSLFIGGLAEPNLASLLLEALKLGAIVVLEDDEYFARFPEDQG